jgi:peptidoglycan/xylan/chitin deacetylase (PgdA/CDA1 family)
LILCYHNVVRSPATAGDPGLHLSLATFVAQIEWLTAHFTIVPLGEVVERVRTQRPLRGCAVVTFDDAYHGTLTHAVPYLVARGIPSTVFVTTTATTTLEPFWWDLPAAIAAGREPTGRDRLLEDLQGDATRIRQALDATQEAVREREMLPATWQALAQARTPLVDYGAHSVTHRNLTRLDDASLRAEFESSRDMVEERLGVRPRLFAYPYGCVDTRVRVAARTAGFAGAASLAAGDVTYASDLWSLPRTNVPTGLRPAAFRAWTSGFTQVLRSVRG